MARTQLAPVEYDNRSLPLVGENGFYHLRKSIRRWRWCKYCHKDTPQFVLAEGTRGDELKTIHILRCCWECGYGLQEISGPNAERIETLLFWSKEED